ncbi:MAG: Calcium-dependent protease precursor [Verrucomicrobiota bacterium]
MKAMLGRMIWAGLLLAAGVAAGQDRARPVARGASGGRAPHLAAARQWAASVDAGDSYPTPQGPRRLRRLGEAIAVSADPASAEFQSQLLAPGRPLAGFAVRRGAGRDGLTLLTRETGTPRRRAGAMGASEAGALLASVRAVPAGRGANPVFIDAETGLRLLATEEVLVQLRPGVDARVFFGVSWPQVRPAWGGADRHVLRLPGATAEEVLAEVGRLAARPEVAWAEPDFIVQFARAHVPNDPLWLDQWHLRNEGQFGTKPGADARLTGAWDLTLGSTNVVIAVMDDGVQTAHPDLAPNLFENPGEVPDNGVDDDGNGYVDDVRGWDFFAQDNDPSPAAPEDSHGTALAGLAAAAGDNGLGGIGAAPRCRVLPLKILTGEDGIAVSEVGRVIHYAAGLNAQGQAVWRGADVLSISLIFPRSQVVDAALQAAATRGRGGLGCAIFCASGNEASGWMAYDIEFLEAGFYTLRWQYVKDGSDDFPRGADAVWLDTVVFPDGTYEDFAAGLPLDWSTGGATPWQSVVDGVGGNHALTGWGGPGSRSLRSGSLTHDQTNWVETTPYLEAGVLRFWAWVESEADDVNVYDYFNFLVDGEEIDWNGGVPLVETAVGYPASHPATLAVGASTDFDYRADYSQFGAGLDFVAPSDGGAVAITTTDRTGVEGYNALAGPAGDYAYDFGGTSAATPLAAGIGALVLSMNPHLPVADLRALLRGTADHIGNVAYTEEGFSPYYGYGRLNAQRAVSRARPNLILSLAAPPSPVVAGETSTYVLSLRNNGTSLAGVVRVTNQLPAGVAVGPVTPAPALRAGSLLVWNAGPLPGGGLLTFSVVVTNSVPGTNPWTASTGTDIPETTLADNALTNQTVVLPMPLLSVQDALVGEPDIGATGAVFQVTLAQAAPRTVTVRYATLAGASNGTAAARRDYTPRSGLLTFPPGTTRQEVVVPVLPDRLDEEDETFTLQLSGPLQALLGRAQATGGILDNDPPPSVSVVDAARTEGNAGSAPLIFTVRLSAPSGRSVSVPYATAPGSAEEGLDYAATNGVLVFAPGVTARTLSVWVRGDRLQETNETFLVDLGSPTHATLGRARATGTVRNDDARPRVDLGDASMQEGDDGLTSLVFPVRLALPSGLPVTVSYRTLPGLAGLEDFVPTNGTVTFAPGETNQSLVVWVRGDTLSESNETLQVRLDAAVGAVLGRAAALGVLLDDDPLPEVTVAGVTVAQLAAATTNAVFTATLSTASGRTVTLRYATASGSAVAGADFSARAGVLVFAPGATRVSFTVPILRAAAGEGTEEFRIDLSGPVHATLATPTAVGVILPQPSNPAFLRTYAAP